MILFLNGPSSSGKSSIARSIQKLSDSPWLVIGIDTFIDMMPQQYFGEGKKAELGFSVCSKIEEGIPKTTIHLGSYGKAISDTVPHVVKLLAEHGHNLIVDEVLLGENHYADILKNQKVYYIGVTCDLSVMEAREKARGNRCLGMARVQSEIVHDAIQTYDLMVDTTHASSDELAKKILAFVEISSLS